MKGLLKKLIAAILTLEARAILSAYKPIIVGVTGSVGKTSTKDAIAAVVGTTYTVRASAKSFNSEFGVPLTIIGRDTAWTSVPGWLSIFASGLGMLLWRVKYPEVLVLEVGVDRPGDMAHTMAWLSLDIAVVTHIGEKPVHVENFMSVDALANEKMRIIDGLKKEGALILTHDDPRVMEYRGRFPGRVMTFGFGEGAAVRGDRYSIRYDAYGAPHGIDANVLVGSSIFPVSYSGVIGRQFVYPMLAACAVAGACGIDVQGAIGALEKYPPAAGRMRLLRGVDETLIIDDTYNSSPIAAKEALEALKDLRVRGKKRAVLGDMRELGAISKEAHREVGEATVTIVDSLVTIGPEARETAAAAKKAGLKDVISFDSSREAASYVREHVENGDAVLCKGSQSIRVEHIVKELLADPADSALLVRQGKEWERR